MQKRSATLACAVLALGIARLAGADNYIAPYQQDTPPEPKPVSEAVKRANVKLVFGYYRRGTDRSDETLLKFLSPNFIQHDVCEPSGEHAYGQLFRDAAAQGGLPEQRDPEPKMRGASDSAHHGLIRSIVADGDLVVVIRDIARRWPGGPVPWMKTTFVDIWRVQNGKMTEQWASVVPGDGFSNPVGGNCKDYHDDPGSPIPITP